MSDHLSEINSPRDLRKLSSAELAELAQEVREVIIETTSEHGGHLAPNLGVVELTIALHLCFDSPRDKIIWDVSHQCYAHKLLTGRREQFATLRQAGGLSGFCVPGESEHDHFGAGHGSTAISAALGFAKARDLLGTGERVVAVVGDGALQGGMSFEALNQAGHLGVDLLVVLNDNEMSISPNVGALANYLSRLRSDPYYLRARDDFNQMMQRLPLGDAMVELVDRVKDGVKRLVVPGMLFEDLGFTYLGPADGHEVGEIRDILKHARSLRGPVVVHVLTRKGKGYAPAEDEPTRWHGASPFDIETGRPRRAADGVTYSEAFADALMELAEQDHRVVAITAAMADGTGVERLNGRFPARCFDVGMCEQHAVTFAAGMAKAGLRPVVAIYSTFLQRAYDQIVHDVCLQNLPVIFCLDRAGLVGDDGPTHHGVFDIAYLQHMPGLTIMAPADTAELAQALRCAYELRRPAAIRYPRGVGPAQPVSPAEYEWGRGVLAREGEDCLVLALGSRVQPALEAAEALAAEGLAAAVVNCRFAKPLDADLIVPLARAVGKVVTVEEGTLVGGFGSSVLALLREGGAEEAVVTRLGIPDEFVPHGDVEALHRECRIDAEAICEAARRLCDGSAAPAVEMPDVGLRPASGRAAGHAQ
ncbi:MAG: 1-deoxy-D-xylulose-5-phosphate synthase [Armatimonadota bacterium]